MRYVRILSWARAGVCAFATMHMDLRFGLKQRFGSDNPAALRCGWGHAWEICRVLLCGAPLVLQAWLSVYVSDVLAGSPDSPPAFGFNWQTVPLGHQCIDTFDCSNMPVGEQYLQTVVGLCRGLGLTRWEQCSGEAMAKIYREYDGQDVLEALWANPNVTGIPTGL